MSGRCPIPRLSLCKELDSNEYDALVWVGTDYMLAPSESIISAISSMVNVDASVTTGGCVVPVSLSCGRLVFSPTGPVDRDYDDLSRFTEAAASGVKRAVVAGSKNPLLMVQGTMLNKEKECQIAGLVGALSALRELGEKEASKVDSMGWTGEIDVMKEALAIEKDGVVARDIGGSDPVKDLINDYERMHVDNDTDTSLTGFARGLTAEKVIAYGSNGGFPVEYYSVKWKGREQTELAPVKEVENKIPQLVIEHFKERLQEMHATLQEMHATLHAVVEDWKKDSQGNL